MELTVAYAQNMIEALLHVHALANMARASGNKEHARSAIGWLPILERQLRDMRADLERVTRD